MDSSGGLLRFFTQKVVPTFLFTAASAHAYVPTITPNGVPVRWKDVKLNLAGNPVNSVGLSEDDVRNAVVRGLQRWNAASGGAVGFDYWQGTDPNIYEPDSDFNGLSSIYFASNEKGGTHLTPNVLGLTQVWYDTNSGEIIETDIVLNDKDFHFTTNEQDTSGFGSGGASGFGSRNRVFIENVVTHELGHAFGLSHSGGLQSTMLFMESPEQAHLGCDEAVAIHALYPSGDSGARGNIAGSVVSDSGSPIFGAHVLAISRRRGTVLATALTDKGGHYQISALEPGAYFLLVEPFFAGSSPLPAYYSGLSTGVCAGGRPFGRTVLTDATGYRLQTIDVGSGQTAGAPNLVAHCSQGAGASIASISSSSRQSTAPVVFDGTRDGHGFGATDRFSSGSTTFYKLKSVTGNLEVHALAYSLYSPIRAQVDLTDASGNAVNAQTFDYSYRGNSGYVNYDTYLVASGLPPGDYFVRVSATGMDASFYPAGPVSLDSQPFLVLTGSVNEGAPALAGSLPTNARCRADERFANYQSPGGVPPRHSTSSHDTGGVGFCNSVDRIRDGGSDGDGPSASAIAGWFAPWVFMLMVLQALGWSTRRARFQRHPA